MPRPGCASSWRNNRRTGATVLLTSHYMADITALCPRVLLVHQGRLFHDGPLEALADQLAPEREVRLGGVAR